jgi:succinate dehydrogenase / fumarate reductase membrane anchor subunit
MSMRTPLSIVTGSGSAREGTSHFWRQRVTALANIPLTLFLVWLVASLAGSSRADVVTMLGNPIVATLLLLTIVSVTWHMRLGVQVVVEDYVHTESTKVLVLIANNFFCIAVAALSAISVLKLGFGG